MLPTLILLAGPPSRRVNHSVSASPLRRPCRLESLEPDTSTLDTSSTSWNDELGFLVVAPSRHWRILMPSLLVAVLPLASIWLLLLDSSSSSQRRCTAPSRSCALCLIFSFLHPRSTVALFVCRPRQSRPFTFSGPRWLRPPVVLFPEGGTLLVTSASKRMRAPLVSGAAFSSPMDRSTPLVERGSSL